MHWKLPDHNKDDGLLEINLFSVHSKIQMLEKTEEGNTSNTPEEAVAETVKSPYHRLW